MHEHYTLTRKDTRQAVLLPQDMRWTDEYDWSAVAQATPERTLSGAQVIQQGVKRGGRPVTLAGEWVWLDLGSLRTLRDWSDVPELVMTLTHYNGRSFDVMFRLHDKALTNVSPVRYATPETDAERYTAEICLMTV